MVLLVNPKITEIQDRIRAIVRTYLAEHPKGQEEIINMLLGSTVGIYVEGGPKDKIALGRGLAELSSAMDLLCERAFRALLSREEVQAIIESQYHTHQ